MSSCHTWLKSLTVVENSFTDEPPKMNERRKYILDTFGNGCGMIKLRGSSSGMRMSLKATNTRTGGGKEAIGKIIEIRNGAEVPP